MTRAARFKHSLDRRGNRERKPHSQRLVLIGTIAAGLLLALVTAIVISGGASGSEVVSSSVHDVATQDSESQEDLNHEPPEGDPALGDDSSPGSEPADQATLTPTSTPASDADDDHDHVDTDQVDADPVDAVQVDTDPDAGPELADEPITAEPTGVSGTDEDTDQPGASDEPGEQLSEDFPADAPLPSLDGSGGGQVPAPPSYDFPDFPEETPGIPDPTPEPEPPAPVSLEIRPPATPEPLPEQVPDPTVELSPVAQGAADQLTGNAFGCSSRCITKAVLQPNIHNANLELEVRTNVATSKIVWVLPAGPLNGPDGVPSYLGKPPSGGQLIPAHEWTINLDHLQPDASYRIVVAATDTQKNNEVVSTIVTTSKPNPDQVVAPGSPCVFECILDGEVTPGADFGKALIVIHADGPVTFDVAVSPTQPYSVSDAITGPFYLPDDVTLTDVQAGPTAYVARAIGMSPETTYYVLVTATDDQGHSQQAMGSFTTLAAPVQPEPEPLPPEPEVEMHNVFMWVDRFHIHRTGDLVGKGEIAFRWGIREYGEHDVQDTFFRDTQRIGQGESVGAGGTRMVQVAEDEFLPPVILNAYESDATWQDSCLLEVGDDHVVAQSGVACETSGPFSGGDIYRTAARLEQMRIGDALALPTCDTYGLSGPAALARCVVVKSFDPGDNYVQFDTLVGIWIQ